MLGTILNAKLGRNGIYTLRLVKPCRINLKKKKSGYQLITGFTSIEIVYPSCYFPFVWLPDFEKTFKVELFFLFSFAMHPITSFLLVCYNPELRFSTSTLCVVSSVFGSNSPHFSPLFSIYLTSQSQDQGGLVYRFNSRLVLKLDCRERERERIQHMTL